MMDTRIQGFTRKLALACAILLANHAAGAAAAILPVGTELDAWSDMAFATGVTGGYDAGTKQLTITATPSNDLEIGSQFGPSNPGKHYGTGGTLGGPFSATLSDSGTLIQSNGSVTNGGAVTITYSNGAPGSIGDDYGIPPGANLLTGSVQEVLLGATGANTLDILFAVTGGALQNDNPDPNVGVFAPGNLAVLRIAGVTLPNNWSGSFSLSGATVDVLGLVPEPGTVSLAILGLAMGWIGAKRKRLVKVTG